MISLIFFVLSLLLMLLLLFIRPSNLNRRRAVYKELKYVQVLPLRIAESDLNAARMLSLMGATNLEVCSISWSSMNSSIDVPLLGYAAISLYRPFYSP